MKVLFVAGGSAATIFALTPLASALRNAGHQVFMASNEDMMPMVTSVGLPGVPVTPLTIYDFITTDRAGNRVEVPKDPEEEMLFTGRWFGRMAAASMEALLALAKGWRPDLVVGGTMAYAAPLLAAHLAVPFVRHAWDATESTGIDPGANEELRPELAELGLDRLPEPDLRIEVCPPSLRPADAPPAQLMRWIPGNRQQPIEPWMYTRPHRHRVCVSSGSRVMDLGFLRDLATTVSTLDVELIVAAPENVAKDLRTELGREVRVGWVPMDVVASTCDLIAHHSGGVTALTAMNAGVPQLLVPKGANFVPPSQRVSTYGAAITLLPGEDAADRVAEACEQLLSVPSYRERARALSEEISTLPLPAEVASLLSKL